jgi:hypothetical protein
VDGWELAVSGDTPQDADEGEPEQSAGRVSVKISRIRGVGGRLMAPGVRAATLAGAGRQWYRQRPGLMVSLFAALTQFPALLVVAWLLPAVAMLLAGRLMPVPLIIIFAPLAIALCYFAMRQLPAGWPRFGPGADTQGAGARPAAGGERAEAPAWAIAATVLIAAGFAVWQGLERSQEIIVARGPGVALQYAYWIAHHGAARIPVSTGDFGGGAVPGLQFASPGFLANGTSVVPGAMPGLPLVLVGGIWLAGVAGALFTGPVLGGMAILSFAGLAGRLAGVRWAPGAALVLALALPQQYVSRTTLGEPLIEILLFGGLCLAADSLSVKRQERPWQAMTLAGFGGLAIGLTALVNVGSLGIVLPLFPVLAVMFVARLPQAAPFAGGLLAGILCSVAAGSALARPYLKTLGMPLHDIGLAAAGFGIVTALIAPLAFPPVRAKVRGVVHWRMPVMGLSGVTHRVPLVGAALEGVAVLAPVALLVWFASRPTVAIARGATDPFVIRFIASLQRIQHLPVDGRLQYYEQSLNWVIWYVGLPCVLLGCFGLAVLGRRCLHALLRWREAAPAAQLWAMPLLVVGWSVAAVLWVPAILPDQPWASRRLVPVVLPGLICLSVWVCSRVRLRATEYGAGPVARSLVSGCCLLALALPAAVTTFDPGYAAVSSSAARVTLGSAGPVPATGTVKRLAVRGMAFKATYGGEQAAVAGLCSAIGPSASVVIVDRVTAASFTQVVRGMCGMPTARMDGAPASAVEQVVVAIERLGRRPVLLGASRGSVAVMGAVPQLALNLSTWQDAHALTGPPAAPWSLSYTVWVASLAGGGVAGTGGAASVPSLGGAASA